MLGRIALTTACLLAAMADAGAMTFTLRDQQTVLASGPIEKGDAAKFAALPKFSTLELDSPGGLVGEALDMAANIDARGDIQTAVRAGAVCASACGMALFVSGKTRIVDMGGRLGIHSCSDRDGAQSAECNDAMAANANRHGVPWAVIAGFGKYTKPAKMLWVDAEDAECWGFMKWSAGDPSSMGRDCFAHAMNERTPDVTAKNAKRADYIACRAHAGTSRTHISSGRKGQGFSEAYRTACKRIAADPNTPKYAAIDIILWLTLTDPKIMELKPGTLMVTILARQDVQVVNCWKCLTIGAMSALMSGHSAQAVEFLDKAKGVVKRDTGSVPPWLESRAEIAAAEAAKEKR